MKVELNEQEYILKPKKKKNSLKMIVILLLVCVGVAFLTVDTGTPAVGNHIAVLDIMGTISENDGYTYDQQYLLDSIDTMMEDDSNKALLLHIDTPGGTVYETDELYLKIMEYKAYTNRPVYAAVENYAASGGYYVACAADAIYANRNATTGSIGVIMGEFLDLSELLDNIGVGVSYVATGPNKAMGNSYEPLTDEQRAIYQEICDESFDQFVGIIAEGRNMNEADVRVLADGRVYTAKQAAANGLIDGIESFQTTLERLTADLGYDTIEVAHYSYSAPYTFMDYMMLGDPIGYFTKGNAVNKQSSVEIDRQPQLLMYYGNW
ncbi:MAG: signal peptide peptidase SppA [Peptococcaceae bacterium]|nr:signal peptide peptidase SppA [Peptococcaceae bacterium]